MNIFMLYSWISNLGWRVIDLFPNFIRNLIFKIIFKKFGNKSYIDYGSYVRYCNKVSVGNNTSINRNCRIFASFHIKDAEIYIGNNVAIGPGVTLFGAGHDYSEYSLPDNAENIIINDYVWIGGNSTILQGVEIGEGAVVGANSVVTKNVEPYSIVVGNPAKFIKKRELVNK